MQIFSSKGDIGVFRNSKRETTVPMVLKRCLYLSYLTCWNKNLILYYALISMQEFNFHSGKKIQHNPPTDLFSKVNLISICECVHVPLSL